MGMDKRDAGKSAGLYERPKILSRGAIDRASVCNSSWVPGQVCRTVGSPSCKKTRT